MSEKRLPEKAYTAIEANLKETRAIEIASQEDYDEALLQEKMNKLLQAKIMKWFEKKVAAAHQLHKQLCNDRAAELKPLIEEETLLKQKRVKWYLAEEERKVVAQRQADKEALEKANKERDKQLEDLKAGGEEELAESLAETEVVAEPVDLKTLHNRAVGSGASFVTKYYAEIEDLTRLSRSYMIPNMDLLNKLAQDQKGENPPSGVVFKKKTGARTRA